MFTIDNFFFCKWAINLNEIFRITIRKTRICPLHIRFLHMFWYRNTTGRAKTLFLLKNLTRKTSKCLLLRKVHPNVRKRPSTKKKCTLTFNIRQKVVFFFFENLNWKKLNSPKHVCLKVHQQFIFYKNVLKSFLIQWLII